eukprot:2032249-Pleurochrysis_carterae.AAC.1
MRGQVLSTPGTEDVARVILVVEEAIRGGEFATCGEDQVDGARRERMDGVNKPNRLKEGVE